MPATANRGRVALSEREIATVLASLRYWQRALGRRVRLRFATTSTTRLRH